MIKKRNTELQYVIGNGFRVGETKADGEALIAVVRDKYHGEKPTPEELIREARKKKSPIHNLFEWNVDKAAQHHWRTMAQYYLRAIHVVEVDVDTSEIVKGPVCAWIHTKVESRGNILPENYIPAQRLSENPRDVENVLAMAKSEFRSWLKRYERYAEFLGVFDPVIKAFHKIDADFGSEQTDRKSVPLVKVKR